MAVAIAVMEGKGGVAGGERRGRENITERMRIPQQNDMKCSTENTATNFCFQCV